MEAAHIPSLNGKHSEESELEKALRRHEMLYLPIIVDALDNLYEIDLRDKESSIEQLERLQIIDSEAFSDYNLGFFMPAARAMKGIYRDSGRPGFAHPLSAVAWLPYLMGRDHPRLEEAARITGGHDLVEEIGGNAAFERGLTTPSGDSPRARLRRKKEFFYNLLENEDFSPYRSELIASALMVGIPHLKTQHRSRSAERKAGKIEYQIKKYAWDIPRIGQNGIIGEDIIVAGIADSLDVFLEDEDLRRLSPRYRENELEWRAAKAQYTLDRLGPLIETDPDYEAFLEKSEALLKLGIDINNLDRSGIDGNYAELEKAEKSERVSREADRYVGVMLFHEYPFIPEPPSMDKSRRRGSTPEDPAKNI